jgi:hypothetical protein
MKTLIAIVLLSLVSCESPAVVKDGTFTAIIPGSLLENTTEQRLYLQRTTGGFTMDLVKKGKNQTSGPAQLAGIYYGFGGFRTYEHSQDLKVIQNAAVAKAKIAADAQVKLQSIAAKAAAATAKQ